MRQHAVTVAVSFGPSRLGEARESHDAERLGHASPWCARKEADHTHPVAAGVGSRTKGWLDHGSLGKNLGLKQTALGRARIRQI